MKSQSILLGLATTVSFVLTLSAVEPARLVTTSTRPNLAGSGGSFAPTFSADGRFVVFVSCAKNLVTNDDRTPYLGVLVRNLRAGTTTLVSVNTNGVRGGNDNANYPSISSNGQFVAFASAASNLVPKDTNNASDVFVRDLAAGVTRLISVDITGNSPVHPDPWSLQPSHPRNIPLSGDPQIAANGQRVVFESLATNLVALEDTNSATDIFARDWQTGTTLLVSINAAGTGTGNGNSEFPAITPDGRFVAFVSTADDLVAGVTNRQGDIYVRDLQVGVTYWASTNAAAYFHGLYGYVCFNPALSADGRYVAFKASWTNDNTALLLQHDLQTGLTVLVATNSPATTWPQMSADERFIAYEDSTNIWVWDRETGSNELANVNAAGTGPANASASCPVLSLDGTRVVFLCAATDLVDNATNGLAQVYVRDRLMQTTSLVSENLEEMASGTGIEAAAPAINPDGDLVAFESVADDLVPDDLNQASDIFIRDLSVSATVLVSKRRLALPAMNGVAQSRLGPNCVSGDGDRVVFSSLDNNIVPGDTNGWADIFMRDLVTSAIIPVSSTVTGSFPTNRPARSVSISSNGQYIVFLAVTNAPAFPYFVLDAVPGDIYRLHIPSGTVEQVNLRTNGTPGSAAYAPMISADGRLVAFYSYGPASDFVPGVSGSISTPNVFLRDLTLGTNQLVNCDRHSWPGTATNVALSPDGRWALYAENGNQYPDPYQLYARDLTTNTSFLVTTNPGPGLSWVWSRRSRAVFSSDSRHIAFTGYLSGNPPSIGVFDLQTRTSQVACTWCESPSLNGDGRFITYITFDDYYAIRVNLVVKDLQTGISNFICSGDTVSKRGHMRPSISADGRFVVFASNASDVVPGDNNNASDIFVHDRLLGTTMLASMNRYGTAPANGPSLNPILAGDGRTVVFQSYANDLVAGDYGNECDVFVLKLGGLDSDRDGMDDDWEMAYFGTLARDGTGDYDGDGMTDLQEFLAGTDPTNGGSILRVFTLTSPGSSSTTVLWSAVPGRTYQVQHTDVVDNPTWTDLPGTVTATTTTGVKVDTTADSQSHRFYRVVLAP